MQTRSVCLVVAALCVPAGPAQATGVTVGCQGSPPGTYDYPSIQQALSQLDLSGPHTITVTGTCEQNRGFGLAVTRTSSGRVWTSVGPNTIRANGGDGVVVNTNSWAGFGGAGGNYVEENGGFGFNVQQSSVLAVSDTTVRNNASSGFFALSMGFVMYSTGNVVSGNHDPAFACDATSLLSMGDDSAEFRPQDLDCLNVIRGIREKGPPRPGLFH